MSKTFNGYNKKDTSGRNMLRIEKREHILGISIVSGELVNESNRSPGMTRLELRTGFDNNLLNWEMALIAETGWLKEPEIISVCGTKKVMYRDTNKLRIYNKWLYRNNKKTLKQVLKYMYSPLFASLLLMHKGCFENNVICINCSDYTNKCQTMLQQWFKDILNISFFDDTSNLINKHLICKNSDIEKLLFMCHPFISQVPTMYKNFYL